MKKIAGHHRDDRQTDFSSILPCLISSISFYSFYSVSGTLIISGKSAAGC
ncbi:hypothetical protein CBFG_00756 [Clostridiales bacterium 1_7_47FAA]|nr:hypothetical protein CBFG_00756 [Clostridiales bacterium 1_7_47FAA]